MRRRANWKEKEGRSDAYGIRRNEAQHWRLCGDRSNLGPEPERPAVGGSEKKEGRKHRRNDTAESRKAASSRSNLCSDRCYVLRRRFAFPQVQERLRWAFEQSKRNDFVDRMVNELFRKGVLAMRWHVAGDLYSPSYARKVLAIVQQSPHTRHWIYSRSWRISRIERVLRELAKQPNMAVWYSCDSETGLLAKLLEGVRIAWMQTEMDEAGA